MILDIYDDPTVAVLRQRGAQPEKLASVTLLPVEKLAALPDRLFALVADRPDGSSLRKYAMHDEGALATSIAYFLGCGHQLPEQVRTKVAGNLVNACAWYDTTPPVALVKTALLGAALNTGMTALALPSTLREARGKSSESMDRFRAAQASGTKVARGAQVELSAEQFRAAQKGEAVALATDAALDRLLFGAPVTQDAVEKRFGTKDFSGAFAKTADVNGTAIAPPGATSHDPRVSPEKRMGTQPKSAAWQHAGALGELLQPQEQEKRAQCYALPTQQLAPLDTPEQIKQASSYFDQELHSLSLEDRRVFAETLSLRAEALGVGVAGKYASYSGNTYGDLIDRELERRCLVFAGMPKVAAYEYLRAEKANIPAPVMAEMLKLADRETGIAASYGRPGVGMLDPYVAVFAKRAAFDDTTGGDTGLFDGSSRKYLEGFTWRQGLDFVSEDTLIDYVHKLPTALNKVFGANFNVRFTEDPVKAFRALPDTHKVILARLANNGVGRAPA